MRAATAIAELQKLKEEAATDEVAAGGDAFMSWSARAKSVLVTALGKNHHLVESFDRVRYTPGMVTDGTPSSAWNDARRSGLRKACGLIDAALFELRLLQNEYEPVDEHAFDPELWAHVRDLVETEDWAKVASQAAIFVEDRLRLWAGHPKDRNGEDLFGKALYSAVFANDSEYRLGRRAGEWEGWRMLGMGFAQALGNVDRHRIQDRDDARRYAIGTLGLGSLLLTQLRFEHGDYLNEDRSA